MRGIFSFLSILLETTNRLRQWKCWLVKKKKACVNERCFVCSLVSLVGTILHIFCILSHKILSTTNWHLPWVLAIYLYKD